MARRKQWVPDGSAGGSDPHDAYAAAWDDSGDYHASDYHAGDHYDGHASSAGHGVGRGTAGSRDDSALSAGPLVRMLRALSGAVAAGLALLAVAVVVVAVIGSQRGFPGPGAASVAAHCAGAAGALLCQRFADRRRGAIAALASLGVFAITGVVLWTQWWN